MSNNEYRCYNSDAVGCMENITSNFMENRHTIVDDDESRRDITRGYIGIMCPSCFSYDIIKRNIVTNIYFHEQSSQLNNIAVTTTSNMTYTGDCPKCGFTQFIEVDPNIVKAISILNKKGYHTRFCCEGHYKGVKCNTYIYFVHCYNIFDTLPMSWELDLDDMKRGQTVIRTFSKSPEYNKEALFDITNWAMGLPERIYKPIKLGRRM